MVFKEDSSLKKEGNSALNYNAIAKMALNIIEMETESKISKPQKKKSSLIIKLPEIKFIFPQFIELTLI